MVEATIEQIMAMMPRTSYKGSEAVIVASEIRKWQAANRKACIHPLMDHIGLEKCWDNGVLMVSCPDLNSDYLLLKINEGRTWWGKRKTSVFVFIGDVSKALFRPVLPVNDIGLAMRFLDDHYNSETEVA